MTLLDNIKARIRPRMARPSALFTCEASFVEGATIVVVVVVIYFEPVKRVRGKHQQNEPPTLSLLFF